jgi:hypothetical protein
MESSIDLTDVYTILALPPLFGLPLQLRQSTSFNLYFYHIALTTTSSYEKDKAQAMKGKIRDVLICAYSIFRKAGAWSATTNSFRRPRIRTRC